MVAPSEANNKHIEAYTNSIDSSEVDLDTPAFPVVEEVEEKEVDLDF